MKARVLFTALMMMCLAAQAQDFTTEMKEDTTHYYPICVANDTIYWSQMSTRRAYYLQKRAPRWKLAEKDRKNFDAKTRTFAADQRTKTEFGAIARYILDQMGRKRLRAILKNDSKAFIDISMFVNKQGVIDNTMLVLIFDDTIVGNEIIYKILKGIKSKFKFPHYRELDDMYPYPNGETQIGFPIGWNTIETYIGD